MPANFSFLESIPEANESQLTGKIRTPISFNLPVGTDLNKIKEGLEQLCTGVDCEIKDSLIHVLCPPSLKIGDNPVSIGELSYVLSCIESSKSVGLDEVLEACCGNERGCCVNWK